MSLSKEIKEILDFEQGEVINSKENRILVSAGPGSGKTYTLVQRIKKDLEQIQEWEGVVACSFTKEASKQLAEKLKKEVDIKQSFIGTIDAFLLTEVFNPYKNRFLVSYGYSGHIDKLKIRFPNVKSLSSEVTKGGKDCDKEDCKKCLHQWLDDYSQGVYEISFAPYYYAVRLIKKIPEAKEFFKRKYKVLYIDEAQDLNFFQIYFMRSFLEELEMKCVLVGDKNQSIYAFRGAKPDEFYGLKNKGFKEYRITASVRCHPSILSFANGFIEGSVANETTKGGRVSFDFSFKKEDFDSLEGNYFILVETNDEAKKCYDHLIKNKIVKTKLIYSRAIKISNDEFNSYYLEIIEEALRFFYNHNNEERSLVYQLSEFKDFLSNFVEDKKLKDDLLLSCSGGKPLEYILSILGLFNEKCDGQIISNLRDELSDQCVINHYHRTSKCNRIMTIHSSKGLEADNVIVRISKDPFHFDAEYKRKMYVAFTRAKERLFISIDQNLNVFKELRRFAS